MLLAGIRDRVWASSLLAFASYIARLCVLTKGDEPRMAQVMIGVHSVNANWLSRAGVSHNVECRTMPRRVLPVLALLRSASFCFGIIRLVCVNGIGPICSRQ